MGNALAHISRLVKHLGSYQQAAQHLGSYQQAVQCLGSYQQAVQCLGSYQQAVAVSWLIPTLEQAEQCLAHIKCRFFVQSNEV